MMKTILLSVEVPDNFDVDLYSAVAFCVDGYGGHKLTIIDQPPDALVRAEPILYQSRVRPLFNSNHPWTNWEGCAEGSYLDYLKTPILHDWEYEVRALYAAPHTDAAPLAVPEGYALVPIEPAQKMLGEAAFNLCDEFGVEFVQANEKFARAVYSEFIAAAPSISDVTVTGEGKINNQLLRERLDALSDFDHDKRVAVCVKLRALLGVE